MQHKKENDECVMCKKKIQVSNLKRSTRLYVNVVTCFVAATLKRARVRLLGNYAKTNKQCKSAEVPAKACDVCQRICVSVERVGKTVVLHRSVTQHCQAGL